MAIQGHLFFRLAKGYIGISGPISEGSNNKVTEIVKFDYWYPTDIDVPVQRTPVTNITSLVLNENPRASLLLSITRV